MYEVYDLLKALVSCDAYILWMGFRVIIAFVDVIDIGMLAVMMPLKYLISHEILF